MNKYLTIGLVVAVLGLGYLVFGNLVFGEISKDIQTPYAVYWNYNFFASTTDQTTYATTTSATSTDITPYFSADGRKDNGYIVIAGAEKATFYFGRTGINGNQGSSKFSLQVSDDGTNWYDYGDMYAATTTSTTGRASYTISATSTDIFSMNLVKNAFYAVRCVVVETTDGEHSCRASIQFK